MTKTWKFGQRVNFTNTYGQPATARAIAQDGETLTVDYLGCQHEISIKRNACTK